MNEAIGIDLGTYNSAAAFAMGRDNVVMIKSKYGRTIYGSGKNFPSFVLFDYNGRKQTVGLLARANRRDPKILIWGVKRLVGLSYDEAERRGELDRFHYDIEKGPGGGILIKVGEERFTPSHILEFILSEIKEDAENSKVNPNLGRAIENAVISVPAYFDATRTGLIKEAAENVGFKKVDTIAEPTAAAIQYAAHGLDIKEQSYILAFDIGAGTLDITVMLILNEGGDFIPGEVCTSGNESLGGIDIDDLLTVYLTDKYKLKLEEDLDLKSTFAEEIEKAKVNLSSLESVPFSLPDQRTVYLSQKEIENVLNTRNASDKDRKSFLEKCRGPIRVALDSAGINAGDLDHVLFVGGPTYMPCIRSMVKDELKKLGASPQLLQELESFDKEKLSIVNPMECVARGASLRAGEFVKKGPTTDPNGYGTSFAVGGGVADFFCTIIPPNSNYPITRIKNIVYSNPDMLHVTVPLVRKRKYDKEYRYCNLGYYDFYVKPTGKIPRIKITLELNNNKDLIATFTDEVTSESIRFEKLNQLEGNDVILQEEREPMPIPADSSSKSMGGSIPDFGGGPKFNWTKEKLEKAIHIAGKVIDDFTHNSKDNKVLLKKEELVSLIKNNPEPDKHTNIILNRTLELLNLLNNAKVISGNDFNNYSKKIKEIEY